eukprot:TRINITY_DN5589_c0_g1_i1.p1 TRINITY_DN5589_c0_g1~~TRINITY_DN5589_c0_g1_i1.p1  ORF type:complete len:201 (-),score=63.31 TRINITY_DN5589_c0_g1_i1:29-631(-)
MSAAPKLYYWPIKARAELPLLILEYAGAKYEWEKNPDWPAMKDKTNFGQLPFVEEGPLKLSQSMAIARYFARKHKLDGENLTEIAVSEQLIEEQTDIYTVLAKANQAPNKHEAWKNAFETELPKHYGYLEKLIPEGKKTFTGRVLIGDLAVFSVFNIVQDLKADHLDKFPKLKAFFEHLKNEEGVKRFLALGSGVYFKPE